MTPHVAFLARSLDVGGAEVQLATLARRLHEGGAFSVSVHTLYDGGALVSPLSQAGIPVVSAGKRGRWDAGGWLVRLVRGVRARNPDILHSYLGPPNVLAAVLRPLLRPRKLFWGLRASEMDLAAYDWSWRAVTGAERLLSRVPDAIVVNSEAGRETAVRAGMPAGRLHVVANGIDVERFRPDRRLGASLRGIWLRGAQGPLIGIVARLDPMKDHGTFLRAAQAFAARHPEARFVCVGGGDAASLRTESESLRLGDRVTWAGAVSDMPAAWNALDLATLTSAFGEGFPNALGEAVACGLPAVATDVGDSAKVLDDPACIVPPRNATALAAAWEKALAAPEAERQQRAAAARDRLAARYSVAAMIERTAALYRAALEEGPGEAGVGARAS
ncbi:MAG: glycosyltransferase [Proteobacteria bacterium]|nr:glycosyltransferase [Pseudomonadota bacterium]